MSDTETLREELASLVAGFSERLRWEQHRGVSFASGASSPRFGVAPEQVEEDPPPPSGEDAALRLTRVREDLGDCQRCTLSKHRRNIVFGEGSPTAELMFIGEGPGYDEDEQGRPFVGAAGQLLTKMIRAMGLERDEVYIGNVIKCRPPSNRDPEPAEVSACLTFIGRQVEVIAPKLIITLGNIAAKTLLQTETGITRLRGRWREYAGIPLMPTFHPAFLLRNEAQKRPVWNDLKQVMGEMDRLDLFRRR